MSPAPPPRAAAVAKYLVVGYTGFLIVLLLGVLFQPGVLLLRDMAVLRHPALHAGAVGFGDLPARNAPQDGILALVGMVIPASWFVRMLLVGSAAAGAWGAATLATPAESLAGRNSVAFRQVAAITVTVWNPFVVERLLQGQWSVAMVAWLLPAVVACRTRPAWQVATVWVCSLTPTGGFVALIVALVSACRRRFVAVFGTLCLLPWLVPSVIAPPTSAGTSAFLGRPEEHVGTLGAFLGLGGMWNAAAVPASRNVGFAVAGVILTALLVRWIPRRWLVVSAVAVLVFCVLWRWPGLVAHIPGLALFRDSQKLALFLIPGLVMAAGRIGAACPTRLRSGVVSGVVALLAVLQVPDAPVALMALRPLPEPAIVREVQAARPTGDVANMDSAGLVVYAGRTVIDPLYKAVSSVEAGQLVVDGQVVDPASSRYVAARAAWEARDTTQLAKLGVSHVVADGKLIDLHNEPVAHHGRFYAGLVLLAAWLCIPIAAGVVALRR